MPFVKFAEAQIHYSLEGQTGRPALILSNSLGADFSMWDPQMPEFLQSFRVLRSDTRGHGKSSVTPGPYTIEQLAKDVLELADGLQFERFHFCGLSMGGQIGMWLAANAPQRLNKLALCSTAAKIGTPEMWNARIAAVLKDGMKNVAAAAIERWFTPAFRAKNPSAIAHTQKVLETTSPEGYAACSAAVRDFDFREQLNKIRTPTLVISGTHDAATTPADGQFLANHISGGQYVELNGAHLSNIEDAARFTQAVCTFLNS
ncbi:MAG TPA: 3-oxoadipate enol-lactonase [Candidatus Acidoferrum sp.]|nr:3-oxoadipate enol-lactonase [Candidatus Acidoferrum sp.]